MCHRAGFLIVGALLCVCPASAQGPDSVATVLERVEQALTAGDPAGVERLFAPGADASHIEALAVESGFGRTTRAVVRERDRQPLPDTANGLRIIVDVLVETAAHGRVSTWRLDIEPVPDPTAGTASSHVIRAAGRLSLVDGLVRLALSPRQYAVRDLAITAEDLGIRIPSGVAYTAEVNGLVTAVVVIGDGEVTFAPAPASEKGQLRLFAGDEVLKARISRLFLRVNPVDVDQRLTMDSLQPMEIDRGMQERAGRLFAEQVVQSYSLDLNDLSRETWSLLPPIGDVLVDMDLARHGLLTYARSGGDSEDISLFDRRRRKNVSVYTSARNLALRGSRHYNEERQLDYAISHYNIDVSYDPSRLWIEGRADLDLLITGTAARAITLRLAEPLTVRAVTSDEFGRLLALRVRGQNNIVVNLPDTLRRGDRMRLRVAYGGRLPPVQPDREAATVTQPIQGEMTFEPESRYVYSNRSHWYPQAVVSTYATARVRVTVPPEYAVLGSGFGDAPETVTGVDSRPRRAFTYRALQPVRYLSLLISRLVPVTSTQVSRTPPDSPGLSSPTRLSRAASGVYYDSALVQVWSQPRQQGRARDLADTTGEVLRFYADLVDDLPYPSFTLGVVEDPLPGGHSPPYFAVLHQPLPGTPYTWARDPVAFDDFPQFFLAHELAHQFWGQAVAGENYHEQWISEGFAQYFALLYAAKARPHETVIGIQRQMHRSAMEASDQGPIWLGYRLGHVRSDSRVFRAIVYNKGALVLHMLRRLVGDEAFTRGLQRFYGESRFRRVGTDTLRLAFERESGLALAPFFDRWVYEAEIPTILTSWSVVEATTAGADGQAPGSGSVRLLLEQAARPAPVPLTVTIQYVDGRTEQVLAVARDAITEVMLPVTGRVRELRFNEDFGALARFERSRRPNP
ncbi:MAG: M1 family metallopeptidase [Luteitalea sp.]